MNQYSGGSNFANFLENPAQLHVMVDIETLSLKRNACITEIGAIIVGGVADGNTYRTDCYDVTGDVNHTTMEWRKLNNLPWLSPTEQNCLGIISALANFFNWLRNWQLAMSNHPELVMWCKGTDFDFAIIKSACERYSIEDEIPWKYNAIRDVRTLISVFPQFTIPKELVKHNGLDDATMQAQQLKDIAAHLATLRTSFNTTQENNAS